MKYVGVFMNKLQGLSWNFNSYYNFKTRPVLVCDYWFQIFQPLISNFEKPQKFKRCYSLVVDSQIAPEQYNIEKQQSFNKEAKDSILQANDLKRCLGLPSKYIKLEELNVQAADPDIQQNLEIAQSVNIQLSELQNELNVYKQLNTLVDDLQTAVEIIGVEQSEEEKEQILQEGQVYLQKLQKSTIELQQLKFLDQPYFQKNAVVEIQAGAGGLDAMEWAQQLERMLLKWSERKGYTARVIERDANPSGIIFCQLEIIGDYAYGLLVSEKGTHRVVRMSAFGAKKVRQTSFASIAVSPYTDELDLSFVIPKEDLQVSYSRSNGPGGQAVNSSLSCCTVKHMPTGIVVRNQQERDSIQNHHNCMKIIRSKLMEIMIENRMKKIEEIKGPQVTAEWGKQIRNYVFHPYQLIKDLRTGVESRDLDAVLNGDIDSFQVAYQKYHLNQQQKIGQKNEQEAVSYSAKKR